MHWRSSGIPIRRRRRVECLYKVALILQLELKPSRISKIVRTPDTWLGNRSILQVIRSEGAGPICGYLKHLFAYEAHVVADVVEADAERGPRRRSPGFHEEGRRRR